MKVMAASRPKVMALTASEVIMSCPHRRREARMPPRLAPSLSTIFYQTALAAIRKSGIDLFAIGKRNMIKMAHFDESVDISGVRLWRRGCML